MSQLQSTRAVIEDLIEAYKRNDHDRLATCFHDDIDWLFHAPISVFPFAGVRRGKAEVFKGLAAMYLAFRPIDYEVEVLVVDGDRSALISEAHMEQRATGRIIRARVANFHRIRDGRVIEYRGFTDSFDAAEQVLGRELAI